MSVQNPINIPLSGLSTSPSDYSCTDGNLAAAVGVVHEDGAITNYDNPASLFTSHPFDESDADGRFEEEVIYIHENDSYCNFIVKFIKMSRGVKTATYGWTKKSDLDGGYLSKMYEFAEERYSIMGNESISNAISVGNTLVLYSEDSVFYFLFKDGTYTFIGNKIPDLEISFGLKPIPYFYSFDRPESLNTSSQIPTTEWGNEKVTIEGLGDYVSQSTTRSFNEDYKLPCYKIKNSEGIESITNTSLALANQFISSWCNEKGYFSQPFLVRCAYRMFDQSTIMATSPVLIRPATFANPLITVNRITNDNLFLNCLGVGCKLEYSIKNSKDELLKWSDIIESIDIFVSSPFYLYMQDKKVDSIVIPLMTEDSFRKIPNDIVGAKLWNDSISICDTNNDSGDEVSDQWSVLNKCWSNTEIGISTYTNELTTSEDWKTLYDSSQKTIANVISSKDWAFGFTYKTKGSATLAVDSILPTSYVLLPKKNEDSIAEEIRNCSLFYHIKSFKLNSLKFNEEREEIKLENGLLNSLTTRELLLDEYRSHDVIIPSSAFSYNNRINISNIKRYPYKGYSPYSMFQRICGSQSHYSLTTIVYLRNSIGNIVAKREDVDGSRFQGIIDTDYNGIINYAFYPDSTAYKMDIILGRTDVNHIWIATIPLSIHNGLNGSVYFEGLESKIKFEVSEYENAEAYFNSIPEVKNGNYTTEYNSVYTSETSNPFVFRAANVEQIGNGTIIALVPAAQALSTGQFGEYPMYAFTTDGVWALYVNDTGGWKSKQPISRDVAVSADSILQLDQSVLFMTERGLMHISGSKIECISEVFDGNDDIFVKLYDKHIQSTIRNYTDLQDKVQFPSFKEFAKTGFMHYDYRHQRIYISNEAYSVSFVFSLKDKLWTLVPICATSAVNSYPNDLVMAKDGETKYLIDLSADPTDAEAFSIPNDGYILTRPLKLGNPDVLKTIRSMQVRGQFIERSRISQTEASEHHVSLILYGTNDTSLTKWHLVGSVKGPRYHFRYGTPFKFFRVAIICKLSEGESINSLEVVYETKDTNKSR